MLDMSAKSAVLTVIIISLCFARHSLFKLALEGELGEFYSQIIKVRDNFSLTL